MIQAISSRLLFPAFSGSRIRQSPPVDQPQAPSLNHAEIQELLVRLGKLQTTLERVEATGKLPSASSTPPQVASATSASSTDLAFETTYTTLRSTEEINATPTSFAPRGPSWDGPNSTTLPTVGGTYVGSQDDTLTFIAKDDRNIGEDRDIRIEVRDGQDSVIETLNFRNLAPGTPLTLSNGLTLSLSAGWLEKDETFQVDVFADVGSVVDPDKAFNGTRNDDPIFEDGLGVTAGSFQVNGETIDVLAADTINTVLAKITASAAGVTASFDSDTESIVLTQKTAGRNHDIVLTNDTSGFLAATKLADAVAVLPEFSQLNSGEEVNAVLTSFTPRGPSWDGPNSTTLPTIGGTYSGAQGNDTLTFEARNDRTIGEDGDIKIRLYDGQDNQLDEVNFRNLAPDTPLTLSNGLTLSLSAGWLEDGETFQVDVSTTVESAVDPDKAFNGTRNDHPGFEEGLGVTAGSFDVNGVTIDVLDTDTINTVLAKITGSEAGVTATYNTDTERVGLSQTTPGSFLDIVLSNDTSGFLAATKLDAPLILAGGQGYDADRLISDTPVLSGISTGVFEINSVQMSVDVDVDSLNDVIARINASAAGVTASLDQATGLFTVTLNAEDGELVLDDGTSGFLTALNITPGTYQGEAGAVRPQRVTEPRRVRTGLEDVGELLDGIFKLGATDTDVANAIRVDLRGAIAEAFEPILGDDERSIYRSGFGIDFDFRDFSRGVFRLDVARFNRLTGEKADQINDLLFRRQQGSIPNGLVASLIETLKGLRTDLAAALQSGDRTGLLVDLSA